MSASIAIPNSGLTLPVPERDHIQGPPEAPIALVEYGDYECPACGEAYPLVKAIQEKLGQSLCFAFRNFPLENIHPHSSHAAEAAEAAGTRNRFWEMHDVLFENQEALEDEDLAEYAALLGLNPTRVLTEVVEGIYAPRIREDFRSGVRGGVNGTPTFFINGQRYDGARGLEPMLVAMSDSSDPINFE